MSGEPIRRSDRVSIVDSESPTMLERVQVIAAAVYLALIPIAEMTVIRSTAFGFAALLALIVLYESRRGRGASVAPPGSLLTFAVVAIVGWSALSLTWSVRPDYTLRELRGESMWNTLTLVIFYVAASVPRAWPVLTTTALASFTVSAIVSLALPFAAPGVSADSWYGDSGYFSTQIVMLAAIALTIPDRSSRRSVVLATFVLLAIALAAARETQNRIVFIALATVFAIAASLVALRWRNALARAPKRWAVALIALAVALGALFIDAARDKAARDFPPQTTIAQTLAEDPRLPLWDVTAQRIRERPWLGYGYGRAILAAELRAAMGAPLYEHPHNLVASTWLQTGGIGVALLALLVAALLARYGAFYRSYDDRLAFVGVVGIALVCGFIVKNLTDDFLYRSGAREFFALNAILIGWGMRCAASRAT